MHNFSGVGLRAKQTSWFILRKWRCGTSLTHAHPWKAWLLMVLYWVVSLKARILNQIPDGVICLLCAVKWCRVHRSLCTVLRRGKEHKHVTSKWSVLYCIALYSTGTWWLYQKLEYWRNLHYIHPSLSLSASSNDEINLSLQIFNRKHSIKKWNWDTDKRVRQK